jgi:N-acetylneuraminate lyase
MKLSNETLHGIFAGLPLPWDDKGELQEDLFAETIQRLCGYGIQGIYNGGSTGEFFAQDFDLFKRTTSILTEHTKPTGTYTQVGIEGLTTEEMVRRGRYAIEQGVGALQVAFPFWYGLTDDEAVELYKDLYHAFDGYPLVHYDTGRAKSKITRPLLRRILEVCPSLIGVKVTAIDVEELKKRTVEFPSINFFAATHWMATLSKRAGVKGSYDVLVYMNPPAVLSLYEHCRKGEWEEAYRIEDKLQHFYRIVDDLGFLDYSDSAIDRCIGLTTGFLKGYTQKVKKPYRSVPQEKLEALKQRVAEELPEFLKY